MKPKVWVISTGGTISMAGSEEGGVMPALSAAELVRAVPQLEMIADIKVVQFLQVPSAALDLSDCAALCDAIGAATMAGADGVVVIQGTDTIDETAFVLDLLYGGAKPVQPGTRFAARRRALPARKRESRRERRSKILPPRPECRAPGDRRFRAGRGFRPASRPSPQGPGRRRDRASRPASCGRLGRSGRVERAPRGGDSD